MMIVHHVLGMADWFAAFQLSLATRKLEGKGECAGHVQLQSTSSVSLGA